MTMTLAEESVKLHKEHNGKLEVKSKVPLKDRHDLAVAYTPGVAEPCKIIEKDEDASFDLTCRGNMVAIATNGTRVLGLGNIGAKAAMPVMEGKAVLFKTFGDVDAIPMCLDESDPDKFIDMVRRLQPNFAGINLEDISSPNCYYIEDKLKEICDIPVFHDDQHGTAIAACSAVTGALRFLKKDISKVKIVVNGCGAAGSAIGKLLLNCGAKNVIMCGRCGAFYKGMDDDGKDPMKTYMTTITNPNQEKGTLAEIAKGADVLIGVSSPGVFTKEIISSMNQGIVFALANPVPECTYDEAISAGARVAGTGRSDTPNQVNNVCVFPGVFRGAIDVRAKAITEDMKVAAVNAIAGLIDEKDLRQDYVVADAFDPRVAPAVAAAVAKVAMDTGIARIKVDPEVVRENTKKRVGR